MFVSYHVAYNVAATLLLIDVAVVVVHRGRMGILLSAIVAVITYWVWLVGWGRDLRYLLHKANREELIAWYEGKGGNTEGESG